VTDDRYMDTPLVQAIIEKGGDAYTRYWVDGSPLNRLGAPEDLRGIHLCHLPNDQVR